MADRFQVQNRKPEGKGWHWILIGDGDGDQAGAYLDRSGKFDGHESLADLLEYQHKNYPDAIVEGIGDDEPEPLTKSKKTKK